MEASWFDSNNKGLAEPNWGKVIFLSAVLHLALFSILLFVPEPIPTRRIKGVVYEVNLVEMPTKKPAKVKGAPVSEVTKTKKSVIKKSSPAQRIRSEQKTKSKPVVIAKRTLKRKASKTEKPKASPSKLIEQAVKKIERKVKSAEKPEGVKPDAVEQAISRLAAKVKSAPGTGPGTGSPAAGIINDMYRLEVEDWIKSNWSYPVGLLSPAREKDLEAIVLLKVNRDGTILGSSVKKRSSNALFDQSVLKAIERSNPLPSFPEGYLKTYEEFEISFNLSDLKEE